MKNKEKWIDFINQYDGKIINPGYYSPYRAALYWTDKFKKAFKRSLPKEYKLNLTFSEYSIDVIVSKKDKKLSFYLPIPDRNHPCLNLKDDVGYGAVIKDNYEWCSVEELSDTVANYLNLLG